MNLTLIQPNQTHKEEAIAFRQAFFDHGEYIIDGSDLWDQMDDYDLWLKKLQENASPNTCDPNWVVSTTWFAFLGQHIVGVIDLRPTLNDRLANIGHIGYSTHPAFRRQGIAKEMLKQVLIIAKNQGLTQVTISCLCDNIASARTILSQGGVLDGTFQYQGKVAQRYIVAL